MSNLIYIDFRNKNTNKLITEDNKEMKADNNHVPEEIMEEIVDLLNKEAQWHNDYYTNNEDNSIAEFVASMDYGELKISYNDFFNDMLKEILRNDQCYDIIDDLSSILKDYLSDNDKAELINHIIDCCSELHSGGMYNPYGYIVNSHIIGELEIQLSDEIIDLANKHEINLNLITETDLYISDNQFAYLNCNYDVWRLLINDWDSVISSILEFLND
tara:strand:- start:106 stop:753 length:648 start_codon:yes stop_codon:yes gene_type:complete